MYKVILFLIFPLMAIANTKSVVYNVTTQEVITGEIESPEVSIASISKKIITDIFIHWRFFFFLIITKKSQLKKK